MKTPLLLPLLAIVGIFAAAAAPVQAQTTISPTHRYAYTANAGWMDFRPSDTSGVVVTESYLAGYAYAANFGWMHLGDGTPNNGHTYSNASATDYGVNMDGSGRLTGYAYAANIGWIQFEQTYGQPKLNFLPGRFTGYAYSGNIGWISLDTALSDLATLSFSIPDTDGDGISDAYEMRHFGNLTAANASTDADGDGCRDALEYTAGTNPKDPLSKLWITAHSYNFAVSPPSATLTFTSVPNRLYRIEYDSGSLGFWLVSALGVFAPDSGATTSKTLLFPAAGRRYFRVRALLPPLPTP